MEILVEPARCPSEARWSCRSAMIGSLGRIGESLDQASRGLLATGSGGRATASSSTAVPSICCLPTGLTLDRLVLLPLGKPDGVSRLELEQVGGSLRKSCGRSGCARRRWRRPRVWSSGFQPPRLRPRWHSAPNYAAYRFPKYRTSEGEDDARALERASVICRGQRAAAGRRSDLGRCRLPGARPGQRAGAMS